MLPALLLMCMHASLALDTISAMPLQNVGAPAVRHAVARAPLVSNEQCHCYRRLRGGKRQSILRESAKLFGACLLGSDDVHVPQFMAAVRHFLGVLALFGAYTKVQVRASKQNLRAMERAGTDAAGPSARAFLKWDKARGQHRPGGVLAKDSPAEGLLWLRRGISIFLAHFEEHVTRPRPFREEAAAAYQRTVKPFNGWVMQRAVGANMVLAPTWDGLVLQGKLATTDKQLHDDLHAWVVATRPVLQRLEALHKVLDLEDVRKAS